MKRWAAGTILVLAFLGISNSAYLAQSEAAGTPLICNIDSLSDCNVVTQSQYSKIMGISLANFGLLFYTVVFVLAAFELALYNEMLRRALQGFALVGLATSIYSVGIQMFVIDAFCAYCLLSAFLTFFMFVAAAFIEPVRGGFLQKRDTPTPA